MKQLLIQYLTNPEDGNMLGKLMFERIKQKYPQKSTNEIHQFINLFIHEMMNPFNLQVKELYEIMLDSMMKDEKVIQVMDKNKNAIKYL